MLAFTTVKYKAKILSGETDPTQNAKLNKYLQFFFFFMKGTLGKKSFHNRFTAEFSCIFMFQEKPLFTIFLA